MRAIEAPALEEAARRLVARLGFTGYCGLDFVLEAGTDKPYFLEFNPRATQIVHLGALFGVDSARSTASSTERRYQNRNPCPLCRSRSFRRIGAVIQAGSTVLPTCWTFPCVTRSYSGH